MNLYEVMNTGIKWGTESFVVAADSPDEAKAIVIEATYVPPDKMHSRTWRPELTSFGTKNPIPAADLTVRPIEWDGKSKGVVAHYGDV